MRTRIAVVVALGALSFPAAALADPPPPVMTDEHGSCVGFFASGLGPTGRMGSTVSMFARAPGSFGLTIVSQQAHAPRDNCPNDPSDY